MTRMLLQLNTTVVYQVLQNRTKVSAYNAWTFGFKQGRIASCTQEHGNKAKVCCSGECSKPGQTVWTMVELNNPEHASDLATGNMSHCADVAKLENRPDLYTMTYDSYLS